MRTSSLRGLVFLSGALGLLVAIFAAAEFYTASLRSACTINQFFSCATVDRSGLTSTLGVPDYLWGILGFLALLVVAGVAEKRPADVRPAYLLTLLATGVPIDFAMNAMIHHAWSCTIDQGVPDSLTTEL